MGEGEEKIRSSTGICEEYPQWTDYRWSGSKWEQLSIQEKVSY